MFQKRHHNRGERKATDIKIKIATSGSGGKQWLRIGTAKAARRMVFSIEN